MGTQAPKSSILYVQRDAFTQAGCSLKDAPIAAASGRILTPHHVGTFVTKVFFFLSLTTRFSLT